jgi:transcriptional regulator with XRE-family HTH domain
MDKNILGENISYLRAFGKNGTKINQSELAKELNVSPSIISAYEQGTRDIPQEKQALIAAYFGVSIEDLYNPHLKRALMAALNQQGEGNNNIQNNGIIQATNMIAEIKDFEQAIAHSKQQNDLLTELVKAKDQTIAALQQLINSQSKNLDDLRNTVHLLQGGQP